MTRRLTLTLLALILLMLSPSIASAQVPLDIGISMKGGVTLGGVDKPDTKEYKGQRMDITYPGFFGVSGGFGLFVEPRVFDLVGLEIGLIYEMSEGEGDVNDYPLTLKSTDLVLPIHLRVATPGLTKFVASIGVDVIIPLDQDVDADPAFNGWNLKTLERDITTYLGFGLGVEIDAIVVKIPVEFRGRWAPGMGDTYDDRIGEIQGTSWEFKPNWTYQGEVMVGVKYELDVL